MARELARETQAGLAAAAGVSGVAVSQYERGLAVPSPEVLPTLAEHLRVPLQFFAIQDHGDDVPAYFRSLRATPAGERKRARHFVQLVHQVVLALEELVKLPELRIPRIPMRADMPEHAIEGIAERVREQWGLPAGPIHDVVRLVERHGTVVARYESETRDIDAFSVPLPGRFIIVLSSRKGKRDRSRFDVAHELGHLVMHDPEERATRKVEVQAHRFAAAFLMPRADIQGELPRQFDVEHLLELKQRWQCSISALLHRARTLGVMSESGYVSAMKLLSARGWRRHEPGDLGEPEHPLLLTKAVEISGLDEQELCERTAIPMPLLREILNQVADMRPAVVI